MKLNNFIAKMKNKENSINSYIQNVGDLKKAIANIDDDKELFFLKNNNKKSIISAVYFHAIIKNAKGDTGFCFSDISYEDWLGITKEDKHK